MRSLSVFVALFIAAACAGCAPDARSVARETGVRSGYFQDSAAVRNQRRQSGERDRAANGR
ncbi:MAG: hypothetical protein AAF667_19860 [Pseudomonadota bacterium]